MINPPGQGTSKKARARRNKRQQTTIVTKTQTIQPRTQQVTQVVTRQPRKSKRSKKTRGFKLSMDPFVATLCDPENITGVKWPAPTDVPTGTYQLMTDFVATTDSNGNYALAVCPMARATGVNGYGTYSVGSITPGGGLNPIVWADSSSYPLTGANQAGGIYGEVRCVSGCLKIEYIGNTISDAGLICAAWDVGTLASTSVGFAGLLNLGWNTTQQIMNKPYGECYPLRNGVCIKWRPADFSDADFQPTSQAVGNLAASLPYIGFCVTGASASSPFKIRIVFNYEGLPTAGSSNFVNSTPNFGNQESITKAAVWGQTVSDKILPLFGQTSPMAQMQNQLGTQTLDNVLKTAERIYGYSEKIGTIYQGANKAAVVADKLAKLYLG